jgi:hypothetical protein
MRILMDKTGTGKRIIGNEEPHEDDSAYAIRPTKREQLRQSVTAVDKQYSIPPSIHLLPIN